jgi:hypothetical protein
MATLRDAIAADTAPRAMQTTAVTIDRFTGFFAEPKTRDMITLLNRRNILFVTGEASIVKMEYSFCLCYRAFYATNHR